MPANEPANAIVVNHVVIHLLDKEPHGVTSLQLSPAESGVTAASQRLIDDICGKYAGRMGKGYGHFEDDPDNYPMQTIVSDYLAQEHPDDFYRSSCRMIRHLESRIQTTPLATGGYVLFAHITMNQHEHILVAMLSPTTGTAVNDAFAIQESVYLDIDKLRVAGRIDITSWQSGAERYISFLKGSNAVSGYFKQFLGCNDVLIAKRETEKLRDALKEFATEQGLDPARREAFLQTAHDHLKQLSKDGEPVNLTTFVNAVWPQEPELLSTKLANQELELSDGFVPDGRVLKGIISFKGKSNHWELKFDRAGLQDGSIEYNRNQDVIILRNIPDSFREEILDEVEE